MKNVCQYIILLAMLSASACSKEIVTRVPVQGDPAPLGVEVSVTQQSRSVVAGTSLGHGNRINIILQDAGLTTTYQGISQPYEFQKMTESDPGVWVPTATTGLMVSNPANVYAHYPAELGSEASLSVDSKTLNIALPSSLDFGDMNNSTAFESFYMALDKATPAETKEIFISTADADYMTGRGTQVSTLEGASKLTTISMDHALSMVVVFVKRNTALPNIPDIKSITIRNTASGAKPLRQGSFALLDNTFSPNATEAVYTRTMTRFPVDKVYYAMMVYPATMAAGEVQMELVVDKIKFTMDMPAKKWQAGYVYLYNVEISANSAQIKGVQLQQWPDWIETPFELE